MSKRRGKASNHHLDAQVVQQAINLIYECNRDFGLTLAHEKLVEVQGRGHLYFVKQGTFLFWVDN